MDQDIKKRLEEQEVKLNAIFVSVEKTRKYFLITMWVTLAMVVLPAIGLIFVVPAFLSSYSAL